MSTELLKTAAIGLLLGGLAAGQVIAPAADCGASSSMATKANGFSDRNPRYQLQSGDTFELNFEFAPEFNQTTAVQPDGFITLRNIGDIHVSGMTVPQLTQALCAAYGQIMVSPSIAVILKDFEKPYFVAGGQVAHPGKYTLRGETTLAEAIAMAGGFTEKSKHSQVLLFRRLSDEWTEAKVVDVKKMLNAKNLREDPLLKPGDMFVVPQNRISKIARYLPNAGVSTYVNPAQF